ncbi:MAG: hypothetical protein M3R53_05640 [Candidatus Eremiobacteraeota bacterium]|nr:hypothetical protein [Candidatus Eremiobacteraeota bacterium]
MLSTIVERPRLTEHLRASSARRITLIGAPPGYGTSSLLETYCARVPSAYVAVRERSSLARFAGDLVDALVPFVPGMQGTLAAAYERALQAADVPGAVAAWFARHARVLTCTIVLDRLDRAEDPRVSAFVQSAIERTPASCHWIVASTRIDDLPIPTWLALGIASVPLTERDMRLTIEEATSLAERLSPGMAAPELLRILTMSRGRVADFAFALRADRNAAADMQGHSATVEHALQAIFHSFSRQERNLAVRTSLLPTLGDAMLREVGGEAALASIDRLRVSHTEVFRDDGLRYQSRFIEFLHAKLTEWSVPRRDCVIARTALALEASGDVTGALHLFASIRFQRGILRLIERLGFDSVGTSNASIVHDAIGALDAETRDRDPTVLALRAMSAASQGMSDVSESLFQHALAACTRDTQRIRVRYVYAAELLRRGRRDAIDLLKPDGTFLSAPLDLRVAVMSALGAAYVLENRMLDAQKWTDRALRGSELVRDDVLSARVRHTASWVALFERNASRATELATQAADIADGAGAFEIASGACSVLYQIAADLDDDPRRAAGYLRRIAAYAAKCGNVEKQMFAWVGAYEIEIESGDAGAAVEIERALAEFDLQYGSHIINESLLSAQVLQATWSGDFERAHRMLGATADQQSTVDREAYRSAEVAVYAAASKDAAKAGAALVAALRKLKDAPRDGNRTLRARLYCALAFVLLGRSVAPRMMLAAVRRELAPDRRRLHALATTVERLAAFRSGEGDYRALLEALESLHACEFGGVARMLEALPLDVVHAMPVAAESA